MTSLLPLAQGAIATNRTVPRIAEPWRDCGIPPLPFARRPLAVASIFRYHSFVNTKQRKTLELLFRTPSPTQVPWGDILSLFQALEATVKQRAGSRVAISLNGIVAVFHEPHPERKARRLLIHDIRNFYRTRG